MCACVCVYLMNNVYLCHSGRGLVCGSVREGCTLRLSDTQTHTDSTQRRHTHGSLSTNKNLVSLVESLTWLECFVGGGEGVQDIPMVGFAKRKIKAALLGGHVCYNTQHAFWFIPGGAVINFRSFTESTAEELAESSLADSQEMVSVGFIKWNF